MWFFNFAPEALKHHSFSHAQTVLPPSSQGFIFNANPRLTWEARVVGKISKYKELPPRQLPHHVCSNLLLVWPGAHHICSLHCQAICCVPGRADSLFPCKHYCYVMYETLRDTRWNKSITLSEAINPCWDHAAVPLWVPRRMKRAGNVRWGWQLAELVFSSWLKT